MSQCKTKDVKNYSFHQTTDMKFALWTWMESYHLQKYMKFVGMLFVFVVNRWFNVHFDCHHIFVWAYCGDLNFKYRWFFVLCIYLKSKYFYVIFIFDKKYECTFNLVSICFFFIFCSLSSFTINRKQQQQQNENSWQHEANKFVALKRNVHKVGIFPLIEMETREEKNNCESRQWHWSYQEGKQEWRRVSNHADRVSESLKEK